MNDFFLSCKESRIDSPRSFYGSFYLGPFSGSQSLTVANALRRTLLSELTGISITSVVIQGALHEFSTLPGVRESVLDLLLNFKEIVLKTNSSLKKTQTGYLQAYGPGVVRACDLKLPPFIQCVDPDQYIATLSQDGSLIVKFTINEGQNYVVQKPSGVQKNDAPMLLDAVFMPVNKVNYLIESYPHSPGMSLAGKSNVNGPTSLSEFDFSLKKTKDVEPDNPGRIEKNRELQVVILEIWTNGSIHPRKAIYDGLKHLMNLFSQLEKMKILNALFTKSVLNSNDIYETMFQKVEYEYDYYTAFELASQQSKTQEALSPEALNAYKKQYKKELLAKSDLKSIQVHNLNISNRSRKLLENALIFTLYDLIQFSPKNFKKIQGFGEKCLQEVQFAVEEIGLELKKD